MLIEKILDATSETELCKHMQEYIGTLQHARTLKDLPDGFHNLTAENAEDIEGWYEALRLEIESGNDSAELKDVYGYYHAAIQTLRRLGLRSK